MPEEAIFFERVKPHLFGNPKIAYSTQYFNDPFNMSTKNEPNVTFQRSKTSLDIPKPILNNLFVRPKTCLETRQELKDVKPRVEPSPNLLDIPSFRLAHEAILKQEHMNHLLLKRFKYIHTRPKYCVHIDLNKLKPGPAAETTRVNASQTYFYNTIPSKKASFTIDPSFTSETIIEMRRARSKSCGSFRRDFAFVY